jgi:hypothetical protein
MAIRSVPQTYRGVRFRSTLEADWACTLDAYRVAWQYEPEAIQLPSGEFYRPDFYLPEIRSWLEVKGPHDERINKPEELRWAVACPTECDQCDSPDHGGYLNPWRMVLIGRAPHPPGERLQATVPGVSTATVTCRTCGCVQWTTTLFRTDGICRRCGARGDLDLWAHVEEIRNRDATLDIASGLKLHRARRGRAA